METAVFSQWALVEIMGHKRFAGFVTEVAIAGAGFIKIEIPEVTVRDRTFPAFTKIYGPSAIFGITPRSEAEIRQIAEELCAHAVDPWILPTQPALPDSDDGPVEPPYWAPVCNDADEVMSYNFGRGDEILGSVVVEDGRYRGGVVDTLDNLTLSPDWFDSIEEAQNWVEQSIDDIPF